jgi:hypothetical protein
MNPTAVPDASKTIPITTVTMDGDIAKVNFYCPDPVTAEHARACCLGVDYLTLNGHQYAIPKKEYFNMKVLMEGRNTEMAHSWSIAIILNDHKTKEVLEMYRLGPANDVVHPNFINAIERILAENDPQVVTTLGAMRERM